MSTRGNTQERPHATRGNRTHPAPDLDVDPTIDGGVKVQFRSWAWNELVASVVHTRTLHRLGL
jgi:hypothetical protein